MTSREQAVRFAMVEMRWATDWQDVQEAMANHDEIRPWLDEDGDPVGLAQSIIREAEERLGDALPAGYSN